MLIIQLVLGCITIISAVVYMIIAPILIDNSEKETERDFRYR